MNRVFHSCSLAITALVFMPFHAGADVVIPGRTYTGESTLEFPSLGASFTLPYGWAAVLPEGADLLVMQKESTGAYIFATGDEMTIAEANGVMGATIDLGDGVLLNPKTPARRNGNSLQNVYDVSGGEAPLLGYVQTIIGDAGVGVSFVGIAPPENRESLIAIVDRVAASLTLALPAPASSQRVADGAGDWTAELAGRKLTHFFTRTGYTEEDYMWLCADGRFYHSMQSGGFGGGASGAFASSSGGRWSTSGEPAAGALTLHYNDGQSATYGLSLEGTKLFLDGSRYFREATDCR